MSKSSIFIGLLVAGAATSSVFAQPVIYASGQLLVSGAPGHDDTRENYIYEIDVTTGVATAVSPMTTGLPAAMAGTASGDLYGFSSGQLVQVDPYSASVTNVGSNNGLSSTAFDITASGQGFLLPFNDSFNSQQVHNIDLATGDATAIGSATAIGDAIDVARGTSLGTATPFIISLGSVGNTLYGVDLDTSSLISIDSVSGAADVVGDVGAVGDANGGGYSGFSALTGVDEDQDGTYDALFGSVNYFDDGTGTERLGGIGRFDLATGEWSLVGTNSGVIFFGFGSSPVPTPGTVAFLAAGGLLGTRRRR